MKVHFIAIGGSAMHNLAIALAKKGYQITGSDDEIFEPSKSRLASHHILPKSIGWNVANINQGLDAVIVGMHARADNPELQEATKLGLKIYSYPEYLYEQTKNKKRIVIGGSHGKTTITSMILHVLNHLKLKTDFMVGAQLTGFDCMVQLTDDAKIAILEGDEYLSSPIDRRPKFHLYRPHIAILTGVAWDHINVFPTFENYVEQFETFISVIEPNGHLVYYDGDEELRKLKGVNNQISYHPYNTPTYQVVDGKTIVDTSSGKVEISVFGAHNMQNLQGAKQVCNLIDISDNDFYAAIASFKGASKRLELVAESDTSVFYKDFAHSPSKLRATTQALKQQFPNRKLIACMELHTFSSLNKDFLPLYNGAMDAADEAIVYFNPAVIEHKKLAPVSVDEVKSAFAGSNVRVLTSSQEVSSFLLNQPWENKNLLMMTSGNFDGIDFSELGKRLYPVISK